MAVVWLNSTATSSTSFNTISIWSTWDDDNNQEIPLGRLPQSGDYIYANGYTCLVPTGTLNLGNAVLSNGLNEKTGRSGGTFFFSAAGTYNITANLEHFGYSTVLGNTSVANANRQTTIQGNITSYTTNGTYAVRCGGSNGATTINGNLVGAYCIEAQWGSSSIGERVYINGSIENETNSPSIYFAHSTGVPNSIDVVSVNGNVKNEFVAFLSNAGRADLTINGIYTKDIDFTFNKTTLNLTCQSLVNNGNLIKCNNLTIYNSIIYKGYNNYAGVTYVNLYTPNPDTFIWKDIAEPRSNPFIILTDAELNNHQQYPAVTDVKKDVPYAWGAMTGIMESGVQVGCVTKEDVREGVPLIGMYEDGQQVVGTIVIPNEEDVREGVHYDNDKIGTLIVQGGGDRLRIADFGYYTNAQSDTYIVDITEADKPKFASAEERILIEMFPELDLNNIPDMYFDDLFVKYLKYRLIVEYYRTAGVNSTFTPSEPTTEIVNYRNVTNEVWLNSANIYLNAWNKKYGLNKPPQKIRL